MTLGSWPSFSTHYMLARIAAVEGDVERVVSHFEGARDHGDLIHQFFANDPYFAELRDEPRLVAIATETSERMLAERRKLEPVGAPR